jgi:hypothetical protein
MKLNQIRRERPSLKTAHEFFRKGICGIDPRNHFLSGKEREIEIRKISMELQNIVKTQFPRTQNLEFAILKSHLIIEYALVQYIRGYATTYVDSKNINFKFSQKLEIAYLLGFGAQDPILLPTVERLNVLRNKIAHTFEFDRNILDEVIQINSADYKDTKPSNDRDRIKHLRAICTYICARVAGEMTSAYFMAAFREEEVAGRRSKSEM